MAIRRFRKEIFLFTVAALAITIAGCVGSPVLPAAVGPGTAKTVLRISGAGATATVLRLLADEYMAQHNDLEFEFFEGRGSSGALMAVNAGLLDLGGMSRLPGAPGLDGGLEYIDFAGDRIAVVTSPDLALSGLTGQQVRDIFAGRIRDWTDVGGPNSAVKVIAREEGETNTRIFRQDLFGEEEFSDSAVVVTSESDAKAALSNSTNIVGYLSYSGVLIDRLKINIVPIDGRHPAGSGDDYPISPLSLRVVYMPDNESKVTKFLDFVTGKDAERIMDAMGLRPIR